MKIIDPVSDIDSIQSAKYNSSLAKLKRVDTARIHLHQFRLSGDLNGQVRCIMTIRSEYHGKMSDGERKIADRMEMNSLRMANLASQPSGKNYNNQAYQTIKEFEFYINDIEHKYGFGMVDKESPLDSISQME